MKRMKAPSHTHTPKPITDDEAAAMAADYETDPPRAEEILSVTVNPALLRKGRPPVNAGDETGGKTPGFTVRLPHLVRFELKRRAEVECASTSELIRKAVVEYFENHPIESS
jgi:hypothetical protein